MNFKFKKWIFALSAIPLLTACGKFAAKQDKSTELSSNQNLAGISAVTSESKVVVPIDGCGSQFDSLQNKLINAMRDATTASGIGVHHQASIAFNRFAHGQNARAIETPQYYWEIQDSLGVPNARRLLADLVDRNFKWAHSRNSNLEKKVKSLLPLAGKSYVALSDHLFLLMEEKKVAVDSGNQDKILEATRNLNQYRGDLRATASQAAIARGLYGYLNMNSVLTEFWYNHFNVDAQKSYLHSMDYEKQLSQRVCGTFYDLLLTSATHPAMLQYLDNFKSVKPGLSNKLARKYGTGLNENYGRELIELYTFGIGPKTSAEPKSPYVQKDVTRAASLLTGWSFDRVRGKKPKFVFNDFAHDETRKPIMGKTYPAGIDGGIRMLKDLASHPQTKKNICNKLVTELAGDIAPESVRKACRDAWGTYGNLPRMYQAIVSQVSFWNWRNYKKSLKNPIELVLSGSRAMGKNIWQMTSRSDIKLITDASISLGIKPRQFPPPTGYPVTDKAWANPNYMTQAINYAAKIGSPKLPLYNIDDDKKYWGHSAENQIRKIASTKPNEAVTRVVRDHLKQYPNWFGQMAGREQLMTSIQNPDYDKDKKATVPIRTINTLILGSRKFLVK